MSYVNKYIHANKFFFLLNGDEGNIIPEHLYLNGKIVAVPRKGVSIEFDVT